MHRLFLPGLAVIVFSVLPMNAAEPPPRVELFSLVDVRLLDGPFKHSQETNRQYLLAHDVHRFLAPYRIEAGLKPKAPKYPNWESTGLDGHSAGHYLAALAEMAASTGDPEMQSRLELMVSELAECQRANEDGYVGGIPGSRELWAAVAKGQFKVDRFKINDAWVPWYNLHKIFAGLRDAWLVAGNAQAREILIRLSDWCDHLVANLTDEQMQLMLGAEHGGMNEVLADVYAITGEAKYLALAKRFCHRAMLDPLLRNEDHLTGLHANTQIPKVIGFARIGELESDPAWTAAARFFWETVVEHRNVAIGGNSVREHFNPAEDFSSMIESREGPETCNTYNMLRLSERLFERDPDGRFADYYERALFNHILSTQHPEHGGYVYFTPMRPREYRVYSKPGVCFWCCVGTGMENHGKHGQFIYAHGPDDLFVNLFIASDLDWQKHGVRLRQETCFPDEPRTRLIFSMAEPQRFRLRVRHPGWVASGALSIRINGQVMPVSYKPSAYQVLDREWHNGDVVEVEMPMQTTVERLPDGSDYVALLHGPILLAAKTGVENMKGLIAGDGRMAHIGTGPLLPLDEAPMLIGEPATFVEHVRPVPGKSLTFSAAELIRPEAFADIELIPFYRLHDSRAMVYWRMTTPEGYGALVKKLAAVEKERQSLDARSLDQVTPGEQQPEVDHAFVGEDSTVVTLGGRTGRRVGRWFGYELKGVAGQPMELSIACSGSDGGRGFDLEVNGCVIASVSLRSGRPPGEFMEEVFAIPPGLVPASGLLKLRFIARENTRIASIYGVRLLMK